MKVELYLEAPEVLAAFAEFLPKYTAAIKAAEARLLAQYPLPSATESRPAAAAPVVPYAQYEAAAAAGAAAAVDDKPAPPTPTSRKPRPAKEPKVAPEPPADVQQALTPEEKAAAIAAPADEVAEVGKGYTVDDLRRHLRIYGSEKGADALTALYAEYGVQKLSDLPEEKFAEIIAKVSA